MILNSIVNTTEIRTICDGQIIVVFSFFLLQILDSYITFKEKATIESVEWVEHDSLPMPWVAVCLKNPYKVKPTADNILSLDGYINNTYDAKDYVIQIERTIDKNIETHQMETLQINPDKKMLSWWQRLLIEFRIHAAHGAAGIKLSVAGVNEREEVESGREGEDIKMK